MIAHCTVSPKTTLPQTDRFTVPLPRDRETIHWNENGCLAAKMWKMVQQYPFCWYCEKAIIPGGVPADRPSVEHLRPRSFGGKNGQHNLVLACRGCNSNRGREPLSYVAVTITHPRTLIIVPDDGDDDETLNPAPPVETAVYSRRQWLVRRAVRRLLTVAVSLLLIVAKGGAL